MEFYSQNGEDAVLHSLFVDKHDGFFVEIGAFDGRLFSNCYAFERIGWTGICIEAHPRFFPELQKNRPRSKCLNLAIGEKNIDQIEFHAEKRGLLSSLVNDADTVRNQFGNHFTGFESIKVQMRTLDSVLQDLHCPSLIDMVSIDVEGAELQVLTGFSIDKYWPRVFVIEANTREMRSAITAYMSKYGYFVARELQKNLFYVRDPADAKTIRRASSNVPLIHFRHPCDDNAPEFILTRGLDEKPLSLMRRFWLKLQGIIRKYILKRRLQ